MVALYRGTPVPYIMYMLGMRICVPKYTSAIESKCARAHVSSSSSLRTT